MIFFSMYFLSWLTNREIVFHCRCACHFRMAWHIVILCGISKSVSRRSMRNIRIMIRFGEMNVGGMSAANIAHHYYFRMEMCRQQYIMKSRQFRNSRDKRGFYNNFDGRLFGYNIVSFNVSENVNFVNNQSAYNCRLYNEIWFEKIKAFFLCVCLCTKHHLSNLDIENNNFAVLLSLQNISRSSSNVFFFLLDSITSINSAHCIRLCSLMDCSLHWLNMGFVSVCMSVSVFFSRTVSDSLSFFRPTTLHIFPCQCVSNVISHSIAHTT